MNIYIDIDGVLVKGGRLTNFSEVFLQCALTHWPDSVYWLSSYGKNGDYTAYNHILPKLKKKRTIQLLELIRPTTWKELKTEAIDFTKPFLWFDDNLYPEEEAILKHYRALPCHRRVDLNKNPSQLYDETVYLKSLI